MRPRERDRGAAAVEFVLVFPLVIMLLITVVEFSRLWNIQATVSDAARVSARYAAVHANVSGADVDDVIEEATAQATSIPGLVDWSTATIVITVDCETAGNATSSISVNPGSMSEWFSGALGDPIVISATGMMPCGG